MLPRLFELLNLFPQLAVTENYGLHIFIFHLENIDFMGVVERDQSQRPPEGSGELSTAAGDSIQVCACPQPEARRYFDVFITESNIHN